jgi:F-type H+/Na+-transporting ATPase subunit alpha
MHRKEKVNMSKIIVTSIKDGLITIQGTSNYTNGEVITFSNGAKGLLVSANQNLGLITLLSDNENNPIQVGMTAEISGEQFRIHVKDGLLGNIVDFAGRVVELDDTDKKLLQNDFSNSGEGIVVDFNEPDLIYRKSIDQTLKTGLLSIDTLIPIGKGQRELIVGDRQTGKTAIAIDAIINQKGEDVICVYNVIGKKNNKTVQIYNDLKNKGCLDYTIIVNASASDFVGAQYISPYTSISIAEFYQRQGKDVLVVFDDLTKHANAYRTISLLLERNPGREAYPGDIFYLHSRLLERAGQFDEEKGGGSITAFPIVETQAEDFSAYIPTNIVSITDGQIFTSSSYFNNNIRPAINIPMSVSRIGSSAQNMILKKLGMPLKALVSQYESLKKVAKFSGNISGKNAEIMKNGEILMQLFIQIDNEPKKYEFESALIILFRMDMFSQIQLHDIEEFVSIFKVFAFSDYKSKKFLNFIRNNPKFFNQDILFSVCKSLYGPLLKRYVLEKYTTPQVQLENLRTLSHLNIINLEQYEEIINLVKEN